LITLAMDELIDRKIAALANRQRGYVARCQLLRLGLGADAIDYRLRIGRLIRAYAGVYAVGHLPTLPQDRAMACGDGAVLSHSTAACVWGIFRRWETPFEVTAPSNHRRRGIRVHRAALDRRDITTHLGLPVTSAARTVFDVSPRLQDKSLRRTVNDLRRAKHLRLQELAGLAERLPRAPAARRITQVIDVPAGGPTRSDLEDRFIAFAARFGLPDFETNVWVAGREADVWFAKERVIVELDGHDFHSDRESFEADRDSDATALALGIATVRITDPRIKVAPEREADRLLKILRSRRAA
jgi:very-short-patch-repair endonuclease